MDFSDMTFAGKVGLITGGGSGMGAAVAQGFARRGGASVVVDVNVARADAIVAGIANEGGKALAVRADITKPEEIERMIDAATERYGRLDFLHNNAYAVHPTATHQNVADMSDEVWQYGLNIALGSVFRATRKAVPIMKRQGGGSIVSTASIAGLFARPGRSYYSAGKAGLINFTRALACEVGRDGIRANCICPGVVETGVMHPRFQASPGLREKVAATIPMGRVGTSEDIANLVLFLASDMAAWITGAAYVIDGGHTLYGGSIDDILAEDALSRTRSD